MSNRVSVPHGNLPIAAHLAIGATIDFIGDYSGLSADVAFYQCPTGENVRLRQMSVHIHDAAIVGEEYGGLGGALANGIKLYVMTAAESIIVDLTGGGAILDNGDWVHIADRLEAGDGVHPAAEDFINVFMDFTMFHPDGILLKSGQKFGVLLQDDFTGLIQHQFHVKGFNINRDASGNLIN